jgi:CobQ-like glutamine amidotransferase family enzyme
MRLYPEILNLYGDYANADVLSRFLRDNGVENTIKDVSTGEVPDLSNADAVFIGAGTERRIISCIEDIRKYSSELIEYSKSEGVMLATGNSAGLFCKTITYEGETREATGLFDADIDFDNKRRYVEAIMKFKEVKTPILGNINGTAELSSKENPMFEVVKSSHKIGGTEGVRKRRTFATLLGGPLLVRNPDLLTVFAEKVAGRSLENKEEEWFRYASLSYDSVRKELEEVLK